MTEVALRWGFRHVGRFAQEDRALFGPSQPDASGSALSPRALPAAKALQPPTTARRN